MKALFSLTLAFTSLLASHVSLANAGVRGGEDPWARKPTMSITDTDRLILPYPGEPGWPKLDPPLPYWPKPLPIPWPPDPCPTRPKLPKPWPYPPSPYPERWPWLKPGLSVQPIFGNTQATQS